MPRFVLVTLPRGGTEGRMQRPFRNSVCGLSFYRRSFAVAAQTINFPNITAQALKT